MQNCRRYCTGIGHRENQQDAVAASRQRGEQRGGRGIVAESAADVDEEVAVAGSENETSAQLERIFSELMLAVAGGVGAPARSGIIAAEQMEKIGGGELCGAVGFAAFVNEQRKRDAGIFTEAARIEKIAQADGSEARAFCAEGGFVLAQLRDVFAAEDSAVMAQEDQHRGSVGPESPQPDGTLVGVGQGDAGKFRAEGPLHCQQFWTGSASGSSGRQRWRDEALPFIRADYLSGRGHLHPKTGQLDAIHYS